MNVALFKVNFSQFRATDATLVQAKLDEAASRMGGPDFAVWPAFASPGQIPSLSDYAQGNLAAHLLSISPMGNATALAGKGTTDGYTPYLREYERYQLMVGGGFVVAGNACVGGAIGGFGWPFLG